MNSKNIKRHLGNKLRDWMESIEDENVKAVVKENTIITGGAVSYTHLTLPTNSLV